MPIAVGNLSVVDTRAVILCIFGVALGQSLNATTFTVTNTHDSGTGSLRQAMLDANSAGGGTIAFNIPGTGVHTISPLSALPTVTQSVAIDGYTQPGSRANTNSPSTGLNTVLTIELSPTVFAGNGLEIAASNCTVRGLVINNFQSGDGIHISNSTSQNNVIAGNFIGTDPSGTVARPNGGSGIFLENGPANNTIGGTTYDARNLISGNSNIGVAIQGNTNTVQGNLIGTDITGKVALGNAGGGINVQTGTGTLIGGTTIKARNIISGNTNATGIDTFPSGSAVTVQGNFIGTDVIGTVALPNGYGIALVTSNNVIGGLTRLAGSKPPGNLISGNGLSGVLVAGGSSNLIQGNIIGSNVYALPFVGNHQTGVLIVDNGGNPSHDNTVGGTVAFAPNIIAANGTAKCDFFSSGVAIGSNPGNINNAILGNDIFANLGPGIDLEGNDGVCRVTLNDSCDVDTGPNNLQNYPVLTSAARVGQQKVIIQGSLNGAANTTFRTEFFHTARCGTLEGEGPTFIGSADITTDASCTATINVKFSGYTVHIGQFITATATDPNNNTSEFSACVEVTHGTP